MQKGLQPSPRNRTQIWARSTNEQILKVCSAATHLQQHISVNLVSLWWQSNVLFMKSPEPYFLTSSFVDNFVWLPLLFQIHYCGLKIREQPQCILKLQLALSKSTLQNKRSAIRLHYQVAAAAHLRTTWLGVWHSGTFVLYSGTFYRHIQWWNVLFREHTMVELISHAFQADMRNLKAPSTVLISCFQIRCIFLFVFFKLSKIS